MMDESGTDAEGLLLRWRQGELEEGDLYMAVREPMHQAARSGIYSITSSEPDPHDVEDAVYKAFIRLWKENPDDVSTIVGLARTIARRRGQDIGRKVVREREKINKLLINPLVEAEIIYHDDDIRAELEDERRLAAARECFACLTEEQRDLIEKTIMEQESVSDWALRHKRSHQAASQQRKRGIEALRRCIAAKHNGETTGREVAQ